MITSVEVGSFKSWKNCTRIRYAPITLFFGVNSSGKSSLNQLLAMLKQTTISNDRRRTLHFGDSTSEANLGSFREAISDHDTSRTMKFEIEWFLESKLSFRDPSSKSEYSGSSLRFSSFIDTASEKHLDGSVKEFKYTLIEKDREVISVGMQRSGNSEEKYELFADNLKLVRNRGKPWPLPAPNHFYGFPIEVGLYYNNAGFTKDFEFLLERLFEKLHYLGPLRQNFKRLYSWNGEVPDEVGLHGERCIDAMLSARNRQISWGKGRKRKEDFNALVSRLLDELGLVKTFQIEPIKKDRREYVVSVRTDGISTPVNIVDVGFGVSQVLPIVIQSFYSEKSSSMIIEQPEIHLHPSVQSELADLFVEAIRSRESGKKRNVQFIIESHSEHLLRRFQRRIAEGKIDRRDIAMYFCEIKDGSSTISELKVDSGGNISNWPDNFFGDQIEDLVMMVEASAKKELGANHDLSKE